MPRRKTTKVSIPEPCQQSWLSMTVVPAGKFCNHCQKAVIDFSGLQDGEILRIIQNTPGQICGRFKASQLDRPIQGIGTGGYPFAPRLAAGALLILMSMPHALLSQSPAATDKASSTHSDSSSTNVVNPMKGTKRVDQTIATILSPVPRTIDHDIKTLNADQKPNLAMPQLLRGHLVDAETGLPIVDAEVRILNTSMSCWSDDSGTFEMKIPVELAPDSMNLRIYKDNGIYETTLLLTKQSLPLEMTVAMQWKEGEPMLMGAMVMEEKKSAMRKRIRQEKRAMRSD